MTGLQSWGGGRPEPVPLAVVGEGPEGLPAELRAATEELARTSAALAMSEERFRAAFHDGPTAMCALRADGTISRVNPALRRLLALPTARLLGAELSGLVAPGDRDRLAVSLAATGDAHLPREPIEVRLVRSDGSRVWCEVGLSPVGDGDVHALVQFADVDGRKEREAGLERLAVRDELTGLATSTALTQLLAERLAPGERDGPLALLFLGVRDVAQLQQAHGHAETDRILVEVAARLRGTVRPQDVVARVGVAEFVVFCQDLPGAQGLRGLVRRLHRVLALPVDLPAGQVRLSARIRATAASPGERPGTVLGRVAHPASARSGSWPLPGGGRPGTLLPQSRLAELVDSARAEDRLLAVYQPVVDLRTGAVVGAEALLRMLDRGGAVVEPDAFIPLAEASGAIHEMGEWVLLEACRQGARWKAALAPDAEFGMGVNLSPRQLDDPHLLVRLEAALEDSGLEPSALVLELTERLLTTHTSHVAAVLADVRATGVHLAADDFGTGYCSVRYLLDLPLDVIKIDRSWTARFGEDSPAGRLADGVARLAVSTGLSTIVEGVETERERRAALGHGLTLAQGYLFAPPLALDAFTARLLPGQAGSSRATGPRASSTRTSTIPLTTSSPPAS